MPNGKYEGIFHPFEVTGKFYQYEENGKVFICRSEARINRKQTNVPLQALFVLTNPGRCETSNKSTSFSDLYSATYQVANHDPTIQQLQRVMNETRLNHVAIINLSDLKSGNLQVFKGMLKESKNYPEFHHSIFAPERRNELTKLLDENRGPVVLGWGQDPSIRKRAKQAYVELVDLKVIPIGYKHGVYDACFYHPLPPNHDLQREWRNEIISQINNDSNRTTKAGEPLPVKNTPMEFREYLQQKHLLKAGERKLKDISIEQYINRLENMRREKIYNEEKQIDSLLERKIQERYQDWKTYRKTIEHYLSSKNY
ncbi:hypothetical protein ACM26V_04340 [Salipaludibacillus sp. HK11]|uniref:hypothetical protein n=1 Tax=Salipaludibacillus sp. HK11 TaxID=3394320 RepID=UPI0039FC6126